jgi:hypothetical protein
VVMLGAIRLPSIVQISLRYVIPKYIRTQLMRSSWVLMNVELPIAVVIKALSYRRRAIGL